MDLVIVLCNLVFCVVVYLFVESKSMVRGVVSNFFFSNFFFLLGSDIICVFE